MERSGTSSPACRRADVGRLAERPSWLRRVALKKSCALTALVGSLFFLPPAQAGISLHEPGCRAWLETRSSDARGWILGYLSGMNLAWNAENKTPSEPLAALSSLDEVFSWMDVYRRANPRQHVGRGAIVLFFELVRRKEGR